jgi:CRP/FNR family transcriptional regulator
MAARRSPGIFPLLATIPYFQSVAPETLQIIARSAFSRAYRPGELVLLEGEPSAGLYIVQEGWLKVSKIALDGREQILQLLGSGDVFNAVGVFTEQTNPASVTALEHSRIWLVPRETILALLDTHPQFARIVIRDLAGRVLHLISLVEDLSLRTVEARMAKLLLENARHGVIQRQRWATQSEIASRLGTVPDVVSRTLRKLAERGLIEITRREIRITNQTGLEEIAKILI